MPVEMKQTIERMSQLGLNMGMTYQMVDDFIDQDPNAMKYISEKDIDHYHGKTLAAIEALAPSDYSKSLKMLLSFIMAMKG